MVKAATADMVGRGAATSLKNGSLQVVGPDSAPSPASEEKGGGGCGDQKLDW